MPSGRRLIWRSSAVHPTVQPPRRQPLSHTWCARTAQSRTLALGFHLHAQTLIPGNTCMYKFTYQGTLACAILDARAS